VARIKLRFQTILHARQRYDTVGDYLERGGEDVFLISDCGDRRVELLVAVHELVEKMLAESAGVTNKIIDRFDLGHPELQDPGDDPRAPCHRQHRTATRVERLLCEEMGREWRDYGRALEKARRKPG